MSTASEKSYVARTFECDINDSDNPQVEVSMQTFNLTIVVMIGLRDSKHLSIRGWYVTMHAYTSHVFACMHYVQYSF